MNNLHKISIEQNARQLRKNEVSRRLNSVTARITDWLRVQHEAALRRPQGSHRMRTANATPV